MQAELYEAQEQQLIDQLRHAMLRLGENHYRTCEQMEQDLDRLSTVFSHYPSILDQQVLGGEVHSIDTLIEALYRDGCNHLVLLPTKVVAGRAFMVAKFNFFGYLLKLCRQHSALSRYTDELQKQWEYTIFSLLIEDVYQVIVERDGYYPPRLRRQAAVDLIHLWDYRFDRHVTDYASTVVDLWRVRTRVAPVFGTMLGTRELLKISSLLSDRWHQFLLDHGDDPEVMQALEEFVFGLPYEEIVKLNRYMRDHGISVVDRDDLRHMLGKDHDAAEITSSDPRQMYRFYQRRTRRLVRRAIADLPGPRRTLEEMLLVYLMQE
ncbi:MAG: hypothetical protein EA384_08635 [Spirochaetaceae bacterium]|nr:MAG: hypothetical protein EA384_08635 [Spirochaetaceae bacterium]